MGGQAVWSWYHWVAASSRGAVALHRQSEEEGVWEGRQYDQWRGRRKGGWQSEEEGWQCDQWRDSRKCDQGLSSRKCGQWDMRSGERGHASMRKRSKGGHHA